MMYTLKATRAPQHLPQGAQAPARRRRARLVGPAALASVIVAVVLGTSQPAPSHAAQRVTQHLATTGQVRDHAGMVIQAVGAENEYADVISQIGGSHVSATGILSDPNADPHTYESSTKDAGLVANAALIVQNGIGYDAFMQKLESASPSAKRVVLSVGESLGFKAGDNPHIWYDPTVMPYVAAWVSATLSRLDPADSVTFQTNLRAFDASMLGYTDRIATLHKRFAGVTIAVTEPVFGYAAQAIGLNVLTPPTFQLAIMEGNDPSPQDVQTEENLFKQNKIKMFAYNQQAVAPITAQLLPLARAHHIPVVGVYETKPLTKNYQQWMIAEMNAVDLALSKGISTETVK